MKVGGKSHLQGEKGESTSELTVERRINESFVTDAPM